MNKFCSSFTDKIPKEDESVNPCKTSTIFSHFPLLYSDSQSIQIAKQHLQKYFVLHFQMCFTVLRLFTKKHTLRPDVLRDKIAVLSQRKPIFSYSIYKKHKRRKGQKKSQQRQ